MHNAPIVQLPEKQHRDWGLIIATLVIVGIAVLAVVMLVNPDLGQSTPAVVDYAANPELILFEQYRAGHAAKPLAGPENPELSAFSRYMELQLGDRSIYVNPEVEQARRWLESR